MSRPYDDYENDGDWNPEEFGVYDEWGPEEYDEIRGRAGRRRVAEKYGNRRKAKSGVLSAVLISFLLIAILAITACETAFYLDYDFYMKEYHKYSVQEDIDISDENLLKVTRYMMSYLRGDKDELTIETEVDGVQEDFFNDIERSHMKDVQDIFVRCLAFRRYALIAIVILLVLGIVIRRNPLPALPRAYLWSCFAFLVIMAAIIVYFVMDFHRAFFLFHEIFFAADTEKTWLLDVSTSHMINILPEGFFADMAIRMIEVFALYLGGSILIAWVTKRIMNFKKHLV